MLSYVQVTQNALLLHRDRTIAVIFGTRHCLFRDDCPAGIYRDRDTVKSKDFLKLLRATIDFLLSFEKHVANVALEALRHIRCDILWQSTVHAKEITCFKLDYCSNRLNRWPLFSSQYAIWRAIATSCSLWRKCTADRRIIIARDWILRGQWCLNTNAHSYIPMFHAKMYV